MVDLETLGTSDRAPVIQIGAVAFIWGDPDPQILGKFSAAIRLDSALMHGKYDASTVEFWINQPDEAFQLAFAEQYTLPEALGHFDEWLDQFGQDLRVWGNGMLFDNAILRAAYNACGRRVPWHYRDDRDVRTLVALGKDAGITTSHIQPPAGFIKHDGVSDAHFQVLYCNEIWRTIVRPRWREPSE